MITVQIEYPTTRESHYNLANAIVDLKENCVRLYLDQSGNYKKHDLTGALTVRIYSQ